MSMGFCSHVRCRCRDITCILLLGRHLTAQQGQMLHSMLSASRRGESVRHRLALIDSSYSLASDTDLVVRPGVSSLCFPWCLRCAFVLTWYKFDTSVSKLPPNPLRGWALAASCLVHKLSQYFQECYSSAAMDCQDITANIVFSQTVYLILQGISWLNKCLSKNVTDCHEIQSVLRLHLLCELTWLKWVLL